MLHQMECPGPGNFTKFGSETRPGEDLAGQADIEPGQFPFIVELTEGGPVAPGHGENLLVGLCRHRPQQQQGKPEWPSDGKA